MKATRVNGTRKMTPGRNPPAFVVQLIVVISLQSLCFGSTTPGATANAPVPTLSATGPPLPTTARATTTAVGVAPTTAPPTWATSTSATVPQSNVTCSSASIQLEVCEFLADPGRPCISTLCKSLLNCTFNTPPRSTVTGPVFSLIGPAAQNFFGNATRHGSSDEIVVCVNSSAVDMIPGNYEWHLGISYIIDGNPEPIILIDVNLTVTDFNEAPVVELPGQNFTVPENTTVNTTILNFTVRDPDARYPNGSAAYKNITEVSLRFFGAATTDALDLREVSPHHFEVFVAKELNATIHHTYNIFIYANDEGAGASGTIPKNHTAAVTITDVNEAPQCSSNVTVDVDMTSSVGSLLGKLNCWDWDVESDFKTIQFSPSTLFSLLDIDTDGNITLVAPVTKDTISMSINVSVHAPLYPDVSTTVNVSMIVHQYPPECLTAQKSVAFPDSDKVGSCSTRTVQCRTGGADATLSVTNSTDGPIQWSVSRGDINTDSTLDFTVCVTDPLFHFVGQYETTLNVSNSTGMTSVTWSVTINDVNQPPEFLRNTYNVQVSESTAAQTTVAQVVLVTSRALADTIRNDVITVWDPDNVTARFEFRGVSVLSVTETYPNSTQVTTTDQTNLPIYLKNDTGPPFPFLTRSPLSAGTQIAFNLQAEDESNSVGNIAVVTFLVSDVNQAPVCTSDHFNLTVPLTVQVSDVIFNVSCSDYDVNATLSSLTYGEYTTSDSDYQYFAISTQGTISVEQRLPLNVTMMTYKVYVIDGGGLTANFTVHVDINRDFPPTCPALSSSPAPLSETNSSACGTKIISCYHVTQLDQYGLTVNFSFVYNTSMFQVTYQGPGQNAQSYDVEVCPVTDLFGLPGFYNVNFTVFSELGSSNYSMSVVVIDINQPPQFDRGSYVFNVSEGTSSGSTVAQVVVTLRAPSSSAVAGSNEIRVTDPDTDAAFAFDTVQETGVSLFHANGTAVTTMQRQSIIFNATSMNFVVSANLTAEQYYVFILTASDKDSSSASATVTISIYDVNQPPFCPSFFEVRANLTSSVGSTIFTANCVDHDVKAEFRNITYGEYSSNQFDYFDISLYGDIALTKNLPYDVSQLRYDVFAQDGGGLKTNVTVFVDINRNYGPECTPSSSPIDVSFPEDARSGECSQTLVTCTDTSGRSLPMTVRVLSDDTRGEIRVNYNNGGSPTTMAMEACVTGVGSPLLRIGQFEITVEVNNTLNVTQVTFNVTVNDVNQAPFFAQPTYLATVPEFASSATTIAVIRSPSDNPPSNPGIVDIVRDDPDSRAEFDILSLQHVLTAEYTNGTAYEGVFSSGQAPIVMFTNSIVAVATLRPDLVYFVNLTVKDGQNVSDNTILMVKVIDVNQPPSCPLKSENSLDLLEAVQTVVATVSCTDSDYNDTYKDLSYFLYQKADHRYFSVGTGGDVKLVTSVPRDATQLVLEAFAMDGGGLKDNTTLTFIIDRDHPPDCFPSYVPPDGVWEYGKCFRVYPNCSDPSTPDGDKQYITYKFAGSWQNAFQQSVQVNSTHDYAEFCYFRTTDGNFKIALTSSNGLGNDTWEQDIVVSYNKAPPKFTVNQYNVELNESTAVGFPVETVLALVDGRSAPLVYSITGGSSFAQYFAIDINRGNVTVASDLSALAGSEATFDVLATDPRTNLNHTVTVKVRVLDVNEPPTCTPAALGVTVLWSVTTTDVIARVNCSDPDPTSGYSRLSYDLDATARAVWRMEQSEIKLLAPELLDPTRALYIVNVLTTDATFTTTVTVTINVDRTPPKPLATVFNVATDSATVTWTFEQRYKRVISGFTITVKHSSNSPRTFVVSSDLRSYVILGLTAEQTYRIDVTVNGFAANVTSDEVVFATPPIAILKRVCAEIKLTNETWSRDLLNNQSRAFIALSSQVESAVHNRLSNVLGYVSTDVRSFRAGSVYADIVVTSNQSLLDTDNLKSGLSSLVNSGSASNLPVDTRYFRFYIGAYYIADTFLDYASPGKISDPVVSGLHFIVTGYDVTATCGARTPGDSEPRFDWTLNGRNVNSMQTNSGRYVVFPRQGNATDQYNFVSSVTIKGILMTEGGRLVCRITAADKDESKQVALQVVRELKTLLNPPTSVVTAGSDVNLTCARRAGYDVPWRATLYRVDNNGGQVLVQVKNLTDKETQANFTIPSVTSMLRHRCDITDSLTTVSSKTADIIIQEPSTAQCSADGDWPQTPSGSTVSLECPPGYTTGSLQYRTCGPEGVWQDPDTSDCVLQALEDLKTTVGQIEEGTTSTTTKMVVEELENSTRGSLLRGDVTAAVDILDKVAEINQGPQQAPGEDELKKFVLSTDNLLHAPSVAWENQTTKAQSLVNAVDKMGKTSSRTLNSTAPKRAPINSKKIVLHVGRSSRNDIVFPVPSQSQSYPDWVTSANNSAFLSKDAFPSNVGEVKYSAVIYRNLSNVFSGQLDKTLTGDSELSINSPILALSLALDVNIREPVRLTFDHITSNFSSTSCQFLNFSASNGGIWSSSGCKVVESNSTMTVCACDHLTNFAVLMSPYRPENTVADVLNIFSIVGCSISIFCLVLTVIVYFIFWRYVKSDRSVLLVHLCVVLILAYVTFLVGVNRVEHKDACTAVAGLLHYLWLVVFFLMLCEGIDIFISIVHVFPTKSVLRWFLLFAYGVPLIIVGISMGVTKLKGYGGTDFCWLALKDGLLWAFVGPALVALMANFVFVALVIRALLSTHVMTTKDEREKAKSVLKAICVMTPILGLSWIFGVMSVNNETLVFQVLFVVFNSLQGLMIFILHCLLSKQIREGMQQKRRRYRAKSRGTDETSAKYVTQKQSTESSMSSNDLDKKTISPFLQVDRQVQQMASKVAMLNSPNLMTSNDTPKILALKNPVAGATDTPPAEEPPLNIQLNESTTDDLDLDGDNVKPGLAKAEPEFRIEAGNLKSVSKPPASSVPEATYAMVERGRGQDQSRGLGQTEREGLKKTGSMEDNAQQTKLNMGPQTREVASSWVDPPQSRGPQPARQTSQTSRSAASSSSKGSKQSSQHQERRTQGREKTRERGASKKSASKNAVPEDAEHRRLDHVYGSGARISDDSSILGGVYAKSKGGRSAQSSENIRMTSAPMNPIYNDAVPALSPTDRWVRVAQSINPQQLQPQQQPHRRGQQHPPVRHPPKPDPYRQPRPSSPRRLATSAESLGSTLYQPFAAPRPSDWGRHGNKRPPPQVAAKPSRRHQEPPVDYW